jgi:hypothetical protein
MDPGVGRTTRGLVINHTACDMFEQFRVFLKGAKMLVAPANHFALVEP